MTITPAIRKAVEQRLARTERMLSDRIVSVQVVIARERSRHQVEMTLHARGEHFAHSAARGRDVAAALDVGAGPGAFLVFRNSSTEEINVLFRRADGNLGLIEPDA